MTTTKEILMSILDRLINQELEAHASGMKCAVVKSGDFEEAIKWRDKESEISAKLPTVEDLRIWKQRLHAAED